MQHSRGLCGSIIIEKLPEPWKRLPWDNDSRPLSVRPFLRNLQIESSGIRLGIAKEYLALYLRDISSTLVRRGRRKGVSCCPLWNHKLDL